MVGYPPRSCRSWVQVRPFAVRTYRAGGAPPPVDVLPCVEVRWFDTVLYDRDRLLVEYLEQP